MKWGEAETPHPCFGSFEIESENIMGLPQESASNNNQVIETVYYGGTGTLKQGEALAYDTDDTNAPVSSGNTLSTGPGSLVATQNLRGRRVVDPATAVLGGFAGIVDESSAGVVGPAYVNIIKPRRGDVVKAQCKINGTKNSSIVGITNAGARNLVSVSDATFNVDVVAILLETKDTSSTAGLTLVKFL